MSWYQRFKCNMGLHDSVLVKTYTHEVKLFKRLYEANGWNRNYTVKCFKCEKCGEYWEENEN